MKFAALFLLSAFVAYVSSNEMFHKAVIDFLDERHDESMAQVVRDQGLPEDTLIAVKRQQPPDWMVSIKINFFLFLHFCVFSAPS